MSYTKVKYIQGYYLGLDFTTSDLITESEVKKWISEDSIFIDMSLRRKYALPITNVNDLVFLKTLTEKFVVGRIDPILRMSSDDEDQKKYVRNRNYAKDAKTDLENILNGTLQLETAPKNLAPISFLKGEV